MQLTAKPGIIEASSSKIIDAVRKVSACSGFAFVVDTGTSVIGTGKLNFFMNSITIL
jgi:hypothetical protein